MPISPRHALLPSTALLALAACGGAPSAGDYASRGEDFITEGLDGQAERAGISFADPQCDDPPSTAVGTIFNCTATGSDGVVYTFTVTIVGRNRMELVSQPPLPSAGGGTTTPGSTPAPTTTVPTTTVPTTTVPTTTAGA
jgi:hypothetical protein